MTQAEMKPSKPTHYVRVKKGGTDKDAYETVGAAWCGEDGTIRVKLTGTQIVKGYLYVLPNQSGDGQDEPY